MPEQQPYTDTPLSGDQIKAAGYTETKLPPNHPWTVQYPKTAAVVRAGVNALPGIGGVVGGAVAGPETGGLAAIPAVALGVGIGRGLRDLIAEGLGLDAPSSPAAKGGRIVLDTGEAAAAQAILPGLIEAMKTPGKSVSDFLTEAKDSLPPWAQKLLPHLPKGLQQAPASILERPAWQTWSEHLPTAEGAASSAPPAPYEQAIADSKQAVATGYTGPSATPASAAPSAPVASAAAAPVPPTAPATGAPAAITAPAAAPQDIGQMLKALIAQGLTPAEADQTLQWLKQGVKPNVIWQRIQQTRALQNSPMFANLPTDAESAVDVAAKNAKTTPARGGTKPK